MKTEIEHCKHFDVVNQKRLRSCVCFRECTCIKTDIGEQDKYYPCVDTLLNCIGFGSFSDADSCRFYED